PSRFDSRAGHALGRCRRVHRGSLAADAQRSGLPLRDRRPFGTTPLFWRDRRPCTEESAGRAAPRIAARPLHRRDVGPARPQSDGVGAAAQLTEALTDVDKDQGADVVIAYEPVWAIGSGQPATPTQAREAHRHIRARITARWGHETGERVPILYGG